jgi:hypothetical protein
MVLCREMAGFPLQYYAFLEQLDGSYHSPGLGRSVDECHINYHDTWEDLPDIRLIEDRGYADIRDNIELVLLAMILGDITVEDGVFSVKVPDPMGIGVLHFRLGTRINRIIKHSCEKRGVRSYISQRWEEWTKRATVRDWAALYASVQQTYREISTRVYNVGGQNFSPPARNCFRLLVETVGQKMGARPEAQQVHQVLDPRNRHPGYADLFAEISTKCLRRVSPHLPIFQIDEARVAELALPPLASQAAS